MARQRRKPKAAQGLMSGSAIELPLAEILRQIDAWLYRRRRRMRLALQPGLTAFLSRSDIRALESEIPSELVSLLSWHNGQLEEFAGTFADGWRLLSLDAIQVLATDLNADPPPGWVCGWWPFARDDSDSFLALDPFTDTHPVWAVWSGRDAAELVAPSITAWFATLLVDFQANRYVEDPERGTFLNTGRTGANRQPDEAEETAAGE